MVFNAFNFLSCFMAFTTYKNNIAFFSLRKRDINGFGAIALNTDVSER